MLSAYVVNQNDLSGEPFDPGDLDSLSLEPGQLRVLPGGHRHQVSLSPQGASQGCRVPARSSCKPSPPRSASPTTCSRGIYRAGRIIPACAPRSCRSASASRPIVYGTLVPRLLNPIWRAWADVEAGRVAGLTPDMRVDWIAPAQPWVDPLKDIAATEKALALGLTSRKAAVAALGWRVEDLDREIAADAARPTLPEPDDA